MKPSYDPPSHTACPATIRSAIVSAVCVIAGIFAVICPASASASSAYRPAGPSSRPGSAAAAQANRPANAATTNPIIE